jgi:hypothetical protein
MWSQSWRRDHGVGGTASTPTLMTGQLIAQVTTKVARSARYRVEESAVARAGQAADCR